MPISYRLARLCIRSSWTLSDRLFPSAASWLLSSTPAPQSSAWCLARSICFALLSCRITPLRSVRIGGSSTMRLRRCSRASWKLRPRVAGTRNPGLAPRCVSDSARRALGAACGADRSPRRRGSLSRTAPLERALVLRPWNSGVTHELGTKRTDLRAAQGDRVG